MAPGETPTVPNVEVGRSAAAVHPARHRDEGVIGLARRAAPPRPSGAWRAKRSLVSTAPAWVDFKPATNLVSETKLRSPAPA